MDPQRSQGKDAHMSRLLDQQRRYEEERSKLAFQMEHLDHKITEIRAEYGTVYNKDVPALTLPTEVTGMIFYYVSGYPKAGDSHSNKHLLMEVVVSHVCHQWRSVALATPRIWASFCFDGPMQRRPGVPLERFEAYLQRSAQHDLELWLDFSGAGYKGRFSEQDGLALFEKAIPHLGRWSRVTLKADADVPMDSIFPLIETAYAPRLQHFAYYKYITLDDDDNIEDLEPHVFKGGAPYLRSVMLDASGILICRPPLSSVTTLRIEGREDDADIGFSFPWSTLLDVLALPFLTNLSVAGSFFDTDDIETYEAIQMPYLKHLRFRDSQSLSILLPFLRAPLLESLVVQDVWIPGEYSSLRPNPYIFPALQSLSLLNTSVSQSNTAWYLAQMTKSVTEIIFSDDEYAENPLSMLLNGPHSDKEFWPRLQSVTLNIRMTDEVSDILRFVEARSKNGLVLQVLDWMHDHWKNLHRTAWEALKKACEIEILDSSDRTLFHRYWPPGEVNQDLLHDDEDPFDIQPLVKDEI